ncbi:MAG TPA: hypothetical protein VLX90_09740 [Steroidobacteraceae bacterium]|nr:hypothetical protein [Steroidobacteraceae bacterium]
MADRSADKRAKRRRVIGKRAPTLPKTSAAEQKAQAGLAEASRKLRAALTSLDKARPGSAKERKAHKAARAALKALVAAKRKLRKAQKKRKKIAAKKARPQPQPKALRKKSKAPTRGGHRASGMRRSRSKPRKASAPTAAKTPHPRNRTTATVNRPAGIQTEPSNAGQPPMPQADPIHAKTIGASQSELSD